MFTGIIEELGEVVALERGPGDQADAARLSVRGPLVAEGTRTGDSINVNGCCLTVTDLSDDVFVADVMAETLARTALGALAPGSRVNLERSLRLSDRLGGHIVQGHVDGTGEIRARHHEEHWDVLEISVPDDLMRYVAVKGSIAIDGVSLTVVDVVDSATGADGANGAGESGGASSGCLTVSLIPETLRRTTLGIKRVGDPVSLEVDVMSKYISRCVSWCASRDISGGAE